MKTPRIFVGALVSIVLFGGCFQQDEEGTRDSSEIPTEREIQEMSERVRNLAETEVLVKKMEEGSFEKIQKLFPDLEQLKEKIEVGSEENLRGVDTEQWWYSKNDDVTIIISVEKQMPIYFFDGQELSPDELIVVRMVVKKIEEANRKTLPMEERE